MRHGASTQVAVPRGGEGDVGRVRGSYGCGSRRALIRVCSQRAGNRRKRSGRRARNFCTWFHLNRLRTELTPYDCRSRGFRWPCPPQRHWPLVRLPFARTRAAKWHFRCAVVGCHLPPPSPHPTCAVWWCVWRLFAPVTPEVPQIHLDSEIAWLVLALAPGTPPSVREAMGPGFPHRATLFSPMGAGVHSYSTGRLLR